MTALRRAQAVPSSALRGKRVERSRTRPEASAPPPLSQVSPDPHFSSHPIFPSSVPQETVTHEAGIHDFCRSKYPLASGRHGEATSHICLLSFVLSQVPHAQILKGAEKMFCAHSRTKKSRKQNTNGNDSLGIERCAGRAFARLNPAALGSN